MLTLHSSFYAEWIWVMWGPLRGPHESNFFSFFFTQPMQLIQNHHSNSNNMLSPYKEGVLRREGIPESIFLAASGTKAMEMLPGFPWPASACGLESHPA